MSAKKDVEQMSINELKVYIAELEAKVDVYTQVISNSNFRAIVTDKPLYSKFNPIDRDSRRSSKPRTTRPKEFKPVEIDTGTDSETEE